MVDIMLNKIAYCRKKLQMYSNEQKYYDPKTDVNNLLFVFHLCQQYILKLECLFYFYKFYVKWPLFFFSFHSKSNGKKISNFLSSIVYKS